MGQMKKKQVAAVENKKEEEREIDPARVIQTASDMTSKGAKPLFKMDGPKSPRIIMAAKAWHQMYTIIPMAKAMSTEVAWYTPLLEERNEDGDLTITVPEIFVPKQVVSGAACDDVEWGQVLQEAYEKGYNPDIMKGWFHLHPGASVTPSGTDNEQTQDLMENWQTLLRGIFSACGKYKVDYFDADAGYIYQNLPVEIHYPAEFEMDEVAVHFSERVEKKTYPTVNQYPATRGVNYGAGHGTAGKGAHTNANGNQKKSEDQARAEAQGAWWPEHDLFDDYIIEYRDSEKEITGKVYMATINSTSAFVDMQTANVIGEDAPLVHVDGTEIGYSVIDAYEADLIDMQEILAFMKENKAMDADDIATLWPQVCAYFDMEEQAEAEQELKDMQANA